MTAFRLGALRQSSVSRRLAGLAVLIVGAVIPRDVVAQDSSATLTVLVRSDSGSLAGAEVILRLRRATSDSLGVARLPIDTGRFDVLIRRIGYASTRRILELRTARDTSITVTLRRDTVALGVVSAGVAGGVIRVVDRQLILASSRSERRIEDEPLRIEVLEREEIEEKLLMTPGDISMMLNETGGLRVQTTSPSLGGAAVRIQGLRGRYTQLLSDGLPLYGGQTGGLGLLQIPPMDLGSVEIIKGAASALYGAQALGGVINLISRRPAEEREVELLANQTSRGETDGILWHSGNGDRPWSYTFLGGVHTQGRRDLDDDGWSDMASYSRVTARPRLYWNPRDGRSLLLTAGVTREDRQGGTMRGRTAPDALPFAEALDTERADAGLVGGWLLRGSPFGDALLNVRASVMEQRHMHQFGPESERDRHRTGFAEAALTVQRGEVTWVGGLALQGDRYENRSIDGFDYTFVVPSAFMTADFEPSPAVALSASLRLDAHNEYRTSVNPRLSALVRLPHDWTVRLSAGTGSYAPTPLTEETEITGLSRVVPASWRALDAERSLSTSVDIGGALGTVEMNATLFASRIRDAVMLVRSVQNAGPPLFVYANAPLQTRTKGGELLARWVRDAVHITASYTYVDASESDPDNGGRREVPLTPRHSFGVVGALEYEDRWRAGVELYYTGEQSLAENPYRTSSRSYVSVGFLAERQFGWWRAFVNAENLGNVRQTRWDPLVRPTFGGAGRWTTDAWAPLDGRVINGGIRVRIR